MIELRAPSEGNSDTVKSMNTCLDEADIFRVLSEALAAHVESVFTDQTVSIWANPAGKDKLETHSIHFLNDSMHLQTDESKIYIIWLNATRFTIN